MAICSTPGSSSPDTATGADVLDETPSLVSPAVKPCCWPACSSIFSKSVDSEECEPSCLSVTFCFAPVLMSCVIMSTRFILFVLPPFRVEYL